jgi:hypothetical protein
VFVPGLEQLALLGEPIAALVRASVSIRKRNARAAVVSSVPSH